MSSAESAGATPSEEEIRWRILRLLYDEHRDNWRRQRYLWSDLRMKVRNELGFSPEETTRNLDYLIQNGWIVEEKEPYHGPYKKKRTTYGLSSNAVDLFQGESAFSAASSIQGMVIAGDKNIVQVGSNILAQIQYRDLQEALTSLLQNLILSDEVSREQKLEAIADIRSIQAQLLRPQQDPSLLNKLKSKLGWMADIAGLSSFFAYVVQHWPF